MQGEVEWLDPESEAAAGEETLNLGSRSVASSWLARATLWPSGRTWPGRIALAPLALLATLTLGPSGPASMSAGDEPTMWGPTIWTCIATDPPAADAAPAARNLRGSLIAEQMQRAPHGPSVCPASGATWGITRTAHDRLASEPAPGGRRT